MGYVERKIGRKFPWKTFFMGVAIVILAVALAGVLVPDVGAWLIGGVLGIFAWFIGAAIICATSFTFWTGFGIMGIAFFAYFYRKNYAKRKILLPATAQLQQGPINTQPLQPAPTVAQIVQDKDEVINT